MEKPQKKTLEYFDYFDCKNYLDWKYGKPSHYGTSFDLITTMYQGNDAYYEISSPGLELVWISDYDYETFPSPELDRFNAYWNEFVGEEYDETEDERVIVFWVSW